MVDLARIILRIWPSFTIWSPPWLYASSVKNILKIFSGLIRFLLLSYSKFTISYLTAWKSILISASKNRCMLKTPNSVYLVLILENFVKSLYVKRSIFQTFWKPDFGARFLFLKLGFFEPVEMGRSILPNLTFWTQKRHISGKIQVLKKQLFWHNGTWILPEICRFWVQNVKLGKIWPPHFNGLEKT